MKIVRTYPPPQPELIRDRNRVDDTMARCYITEYDNRSLLDFKDDVVVLEWDVAVSREDLYEFCRFARDLSHRVIVAPYRLYPTSDNRLPAHGVWAHRVVTAPGPMITRYVTWEDQTCDLFSLGMAYLPRDIIQGFVDANPNRRMTDADLSAWHYREVGNPVPILWTVRPVHLNYRIPEAFPWS